MISVTPARMDQDLEAVYRLTHDTWVDDGLIDPLPGKRLVRHPDLDHSPQSVIFMARDERGELIGTNTITLDGPLGIPMDHGARDDVDRIRTESPVVAGSWRIATVRNCRNRVSVLTALILATIDQAEEWGVDTCLFLFHEKHERIYKKLIGATTVGRKPGFYPDVPHLNWVLMRVDATKSENGYALLRNMVSRMHQPALTQI